jgi:hypothetical protein
MNRFKFILLITAGVLFTAILILMIILQSAGTPGIVAEKEVSSPDKHKLEEPTEKDATTREVTFLYLSNRSYRFIPKKGELTLRERKEDLFRDFLAQLIGNDVSGLIKPIPVDLDIRSLYYYPEDRTLILDLATSPQSSPLQGTMAELEFIYFFVNNLCTNFRDEIRLVKLLINGNEMTTITGHIDTINPFRPDFSHFAY